MSDTSGSEQPPRWWPGRTSAIISGVLAALAVPLLVIGSWMFLAVLFASPCDRATHRGDSDYCGDVGIANAITFIFATFMVAVGGSMMTGAAGLFLRPGLRGRVMLAIVGVIVGLPIVFLLALRLISLSLR
jgi:hypothetical protein